MVTCHLACLFAPHFATDKHKECVFVSAQGYYIVGYLCISVRLTVCVCVRAYTSGKNSSYEI